MPQKTNLVAQEIQNTLSSSQRTHTHQLPTPSQGPHQQTCMSTNQATPSPGQLFQPTRPKPQSATPKNSGLKEPGNPHHPTRDTNSPNQNTQGAANDKPGLHSPPSDPLRPSGAAPWLADLKKVTQRDRRGQIACSPPVVSPSVQVTAHRSAPKCAAARTNRRITAM
jgi:hypothetical protein